MDKKTIRGIVAAFIISCSVFFLGYAKIQEPQEVYRVYLDGKSMGLIYSKEELETFIDEEEEATKKQYNVEKVHIPNNLDIVKEITYNEKISSTEHIYSKIQEEASFTIKGYRIKIKGVEETTEEGIKKNEDVIVNVLDRKIFTDAVEVNIAAFVDDEGYEKFKLNKQEQIEETGTLIEDIYIQNETTIKETNISTKEKIFLDSNELSKYLMFGTLEEQQKYVVKEGDTIEDVSQNNKLSIGEFLIANTDFSGADNLLYEGQEVVLGIIQPAFKVIEELHTVSLEENKFTTVYEEDSNLPIGTEVIKQNGENGLDRVTRKIKKSNGDIVSAVTDQSETEIIKAPTEQIVIRGNKEISGVGNVGLWSWPTNKNYVVTSGFGWRWGKFHEGIDIAGTGYRSPIYAANNGVVVKATYTSYNGNFIYIDHQNGYYSVYAHLDSLDVKAGQLVQMGQVIGKMGSTGYAFGVHLHFAIYSGFPYGGGVAKSPLGFY